MATGTATEGMTWLSSRTPGTGLDRALA